MSTEIESSIERYLNALDTSDRQEPERKQSTTMRLENKIAAIKVQMQ